MIDREIVRYLIGGVWNSLVGWAAFTLVWFALSGICNLWTISAIAYLLATTQAFWVQRHLVFRQTTQAAWQQFLKFQFSYLILLGVEALVVNALSSQHVNPLVAWVIGVILLSASGFVLGKSFTFNPAALDFGLAAARVRASLRGHGLPLLCCTLSVAAFEWCWGDRFYSDLTHVGHDFALSGLVLLEGKYWVDSNGFIAAVFNPPWFTPAWCAGAPFYADPQSAFYSPLQLFSLWVDPIEATHLDALLFAVMAFWGGYAVARKVMAWAPPAASVFGVLGMANSFMPLRSAVGEGGFQPLYIWTLLSLALCWPVAGSARRSLGWPAVAIALGLTAWLQFGFAGMLVPGFLATLLFCLTLVLWGHARLWPMVARAAIGGVLAMLLNASKLYESVSLMRYFPRDFYAMPGFASLGDAATSAALALIQPSQWTYYFGLRRMSDVRFAVLPHEWAMNFGFGALAMALLFGLYLLYQRRNRTPEEFKIRMGMDQALALVACLGILLIPLLLLWNDGAMRLVIKQIPILKSAAWPMRWIVLYLPVAQLLLALPAHAVLRKLQAPAAALVAGAAMLLIWVGPLTEPFDYYVDSGVQAYDPKPLLRAFTYSRSHAPIAIEGIAAGGSEQLDGGRNDSMLRGVSQGMCYNPLYGYRLESFPQKQRLKAGPVLDADENGQSRLYNPACLVHPGENSCQPGAGFELKNPQARAQAQLFLQRKPYAWNRPPAGAALSWISQITFWMLLTLIALRFWQAVLRLAQPPAAIKPVDEIRLPQNQDS